jgi:hypothetical protein
VNIAPIAAVRNVYRDVVGNPDGKELGVGGKLK